MSEIQIQKSHRETIVPFPLSLQLQIYSLQFNLKKDSSLRVSWEYLEICHNLKFVTTNSKNYSLRKIPHVRIPLTACFRIFDISY